MAAGGDRVGAPPEVPESWPRPPGGWPGELWSVRFDAARFPGGPDGPDWTDGPGGPDGAARLPAAANCQRFAYAVLALFGVAVPPLRSRELWAGAAGAAGAGTRRVPAADLAPLDLVLVAPGPDPFGAHVDVVVAAGDVLHLCREAARPAVWSLADFAARPRYATLLGGVRFNVDRGLEQVRGDVVGGQRATDPERAEAALRVDLDRA